MERRQWIVSGRFWVRLYCVMGHSCRSLTKVLDTMQQMASDINKIRRSSSNNYPMGIDRANASYR